VLCASCGLPSLPGHRCADAREPGDVALDPDDAFWARTARAYDLRREAEALSPEYVRWLACGKTGPEPLVPRDVRRRILEIADEQGELLASE
jgi:hypothetical protein